MAFCMCVKSASAVFGSFRTKTELHALVLKLAQAAPRKRASEPTSQVGAAGVAGAGLPVCGIGLEQASIDAAGDAGCVGMQARIPSAPNQQGR